MSSIDKLFLKLKNTPQNLKFNEITKILEHLGFSKRDAKGSHIRFTNGNIALDFPLHKNNCKDIYKKNLLKKLIKHKFINND